MATISPDKLAKARQAAARLHTVTYDRASADAALQALEDWLESERPAIGATIDNATLPFALTNAEKTVLAAVYFVFKARFEIDQLEGN